MKSKNQILSHKLLKLRYEINFRKKLCKIVEGKGWILKKITGSHHIYEKPDDSKIISIPVHRNQDLMLGTLKSIMKIAELVEDDL